MGPTESGELPPGPQTTVQYELLRTTLLRARVVGTPRGFVVMPDNGLSRVDGGRVAGPGGCLRLPEVRSRRRGGVGGVVQTRRSG